MARKRQRRRDPPAAREGDAPERKEPIGPPVKTAPLGARRAAVAGAAVGLLAFGLYLRTASFEFTRTDDVVLLVDNARFISDLGNLPEAFARPFFQTSGRGEPYYRPLATISFMIDAQFARDEEAPGGLDPRPFHLTNTLLHAVASVLFFLFLRRFTEHEWAAVIGGCLFAVHPALTEAVAWIPGRTDVLLTVFGLGSLLCFARFVRSRDGLAAVGTAGFFALALLSKEAAVVIPLVLLCHLWSTRGDGAVLRDARLWTSGTLVSALWLVLFLSAAEGRPRESLGERAAVFFSNLIVVPMHLGKLVFPGRLSVLAIVEDTPWVAGAVAIAGAIALGGWLPGEHRRRFLFGGAVFLLFVLPGLPVSDYLILENRLYFPAVGVITALLVVGLFIQGRHGDRAAPGLIAAAAASGLTLVALTCRYTGDFENLGAFSAAAVEQSPHSALAHLNRGIAFHRQGGEAAGERAEAHYRRAIELDETQAVVHNNLGLIHLGRGEVDAAEREFRREIEINPTYDKAHYNLGLVLNQRGQAELAASSFERAVEINPANVDAHGELLLHYSASGDFDAAERHRRAMESLGVKFFTPE